MGQFMIKTSVPFGLTYHFPNLHHMRHTNYSIVNLHKNIKYMIICISISFCGANITL